MKKVFYAGPTLRVLCPKNNLTALSNLLEVDYPLFIEKAFVEKEDGSVDIHLFPNHNLEVGRNCWLKCFSSQDPLSISGEFIERELSVFRQQFEHSISEVSEIAITSVDWTILSYFVDN